MADGSGTLERVQTRWLPSARRGADPAVEMPPLPRAGALPVLPASAPRRAERQAPLLERLRAALYRPTAMPPGEVALDAGAALDAPTIRQRLYGRGYLVPGDAAWLLDLVAPFSLTASSLLLDLAAGLGGPARTIAQAFHSRVTGLERDHGLAQQANAMSAALGVAHLVRIKSYDLDSLELGEARFDGAFGREPTYVIAEKERFLRVVAQSLRAGGPIVLTDFVLDRGAGERDELGAWRDSLARRAALWTFSQYADCFKSLGFELRCAEDISAVYRRHILAGWMRYLRSGDIRHRPAAQIDFVIAEAEAWQCTVAALESGALKYYRLEAVACFSSR